MTAFTLWFNPVSSEQVFPISNGLPIPNVGQVNLGCPMTYLPNPEAYNAIQKFPYPPYGSILTFTGPPQPEPQVSPTRGTFGWILYFNTSNNSLSIDPVEGWLPINLPNSIFHYDSTYNTLSVSDLNLVTANYGPSASVSSESASVSSESASVSSESVSVSTESVSVSSESVSVSSESVSVSSESASVSSESASVESVESASVSSVSSESVSVSSESASVSTESVSVESVSVESASVESAKSSVAGSSS